MSESGGEAAKLKKFSDAGRAKNVGYPTTVENDPSSYFGLVVLNKNSYEYKALSFIT